jgi:hypothetical protein
MLLFGRANIEVEPSTISPWLDANFAPVDVVSEMLGSQTHRRFIKTHTPLDGIPFFAECTYLVVYRDPRDTYFSLVSHLRNKTEVKASIPAEVHSGFRQWVQAPFVEGAAQQGSLAYLTHHFKTFWRHRDLPNLHLFHYSDFKRDLPASIRNVGEALGIVVDQSQAKAMAKTASFENMKANARQFAPGASRGQWRTNEGFFDNGQSGRWRGILDEPDLQIYDARIAEMLSPDEVHWLEQGGA